MYATEICEGKKSTHQILANQINTHHETGSNKLSKLLHYIKSTCQVVLQTTTTPPISSIPPRDSQGLPGTPHVTPHTPDHYALHHPGFSLLIPISISLSCIC